METHMVAHLCGFGWKGFVFRARGHIEIAKWRDSSRFYRDLLGNSYMKEDIEESLFFRKWSAYEIYRIFLQLGSDEVLSASNYHV